ncbi:hypothetical protein CEXT_263401 [Caerostris extrusa]|uniref:Uncharacterized protein n=1 Tax=Caerostris extrusa TaxID=172846 RepID=A0AAV4N3Y6_CAEEX|nr:hypothetical protein CEXT_263401 [Caerostris extrusa]
MLVSRDKTTAQLFTLSTKPHNPSPFYDSERIQITQLTRYLGIEVDSKLRWADHIESAVNKTSKRWKMTKRLPGTTWEATQTTSSSQSNKSYVRPVLRMARTYNAVNNNTKDKLNIVQNSTLRLIYGQPDQPQ